ncbi:MAG TPA: DUF1697 domain-containing protein, partial [Allosphingosinicella sp.]
MAASGVADRGASSYWMRMRSFIALLRGINVGGKTSIPMAELRALAEGIGLSDVRTYIQSGNLLFDAEQP